MCYKYVRLVNEELLLPPRGDYFRPPFTGMDVVLAPELPVRVVNNGDGGSVACGRIYRRLGFVRTFGFRAAFYTPGTFVRGEWCGHLRDGPRSGLPTSGSASFSASPKAWFRWFQCLKLAEGAPV